MADLKTIQAAAFTLDRVELPPHLWTAIRGRVAEEPRRSVPGRLLAFPQSRAALAIWVAAAAALLVATTVGIYPLLRSAPPHSENAAGARGAEPVGDGRLRPVRAAGG